MQQLARHTLKTMMVTTVAAVALGACTREERQEVRTEAKQATNTGANVIDNAALTTKVKAALLADEMVKGTQINVDSSNGVVTLKGTVDSTAHMQRAEQVATGVSGVTRVQNNLTASASGTTGSTMTTPPSSTTTPSTTMPPAGKTTPPTSMTIPADSQRVAATTTPPSSAGSMPSLASGSASTMEADTVRRVQQQLTDRGFNPGPVDGIMGPNTRAALRSFKQKEGMSGTDLDQATLRALGVGTT